MPAWLGRKRKEIAIAREEAPTAPEVQDRRVRRTRKALRLALLDLLLDKPLDQVTVRDIAAAADISYPTFFRHYADKEALLSDLADDEIATLLDLTLPLFSADDGQASTVTLCRAVKANERLWLNLLTGGAAAAIRASFIAQVQQRSAQWPERVGWLPEEVGTPILCGLTLDVLAWWLGKAPWRPAEDVAPILARFFALAATGRLPDPAT